MLQYTSMEPQLPTPYVSPERGPTDDGQRGEKLPTPHVERGNLTRPEAPAPAGQEQRGFEQQTQSSGGGDPAWQSSAVQQNPVPVAPQPATSVKANSAATDTPLTANDDDLIEQEWVAKAKKIVSSTKDDPYRQEHEVSKLQADYLQKRYGKEIKLPVDI